MGRAVSGAARGWDVPEPRPKPEQGDFSPIIKGQEKGVKSQKLQRQSRRLWSAAILRRFSILECGDSSPLWLCLFFGVRRFFAALALPFFVGSHLPQKRR